MTWVAFGAGLLGCSATGCQEVPRTYSTRAADGEVIFRDAFERRELGADWSVTGDASALWIDGGVLKQRGSRNHPLWLDTPLPDDFRIELDAWALSEEGDIKVEVCGDGSSYATSVNYVASGYVLIFGGWNNSQSMIARRNEHGRSRAVTTEPKVEPNRRYRFTITRVGNELVWEVDGRELLVLEDQQPLRGPGQDRFALSGWEAETHFDNIVIEAL